ATCCHSSLNPAKPELAPPRRRGCSMAPRSSRCCSSHRAGSLSSLAAPSTRSILMIRRVWAATAVLCLALTGCSKAAPDDQTDGGVKTGPGVSDTTIRLGVMVDLTAVFAPLAKSVVQGIELYWKQQNEAGGVCGRTVEVTVRDHAYDPQKAVSIYRELANEVLGWQTVLGSPVMTALRPSITQ